jgi:hypothetical protein
LTSWSSENWRAEPLVDWNRDVSGCGVSGAVSGLEDLPARPAIRIVGFIERPLPQGDAQVFRDLDVLETNLGEALGDVGSSDPHALPKRIAVVDGAEGVELELPIPDEPPWLGAVSLLLLAIPNLVRFASGGRGEQSLRLRAVA